MVDTRPDAQAIQKARVSGRRRQHPDIHLSTNSDRKSDERLQERVIEATVES